MYIIALYGTKTFKNLNKLRCKLIVTLISKNKSMQLSSLPPVEYVAKQHIKRVYLQFLQWKNNPVPPAQWSWKRNNFSFQLK